MKRIVMGALLCLMACGGHDETESTAEELTRQQKDSLLATMPLPGAGAVGKALQVQDASRRRAEAHDSIR